MIFFRILRPTPHEWIMKIDAIDISSDSLIGKKLPGDYADAFECRISTAANITPDQILISFWLESPAWIGFLFQLRDLLVRPFGLETADKKRAEELKSAILHGGKYRMMEVVAKSPTETLMLLDDKHLKAYLSAYRIIESDQFQTIGIATVVEFHNRLGRYYFGLIRPFHRWVVCGQLKHTIRKITASTPTISTEK